MNVRSHHHLGNWLMLSSKHALINQRTCRCTALKKAMNIALHCAASSTLLLTQSTHGGEKLKDHGTHLTLAARLSSWHGDGSDLRGSLKNIEDTTIQMLRRAPSRNSIQIHQDPYTTICQSSKHGKRARRPSQTRSKSQAHVFRLLPRVHSQF